MFVKKFHGCNSNLLQKKRVVQSFWASRLIPPFSLQVSFKGTLGAVIVVSSVQTRRLENGVSIEVVMTKLSKSVVKNSIFKRSS